MNWSGELAADVPLGVVMVILTVPLPAGLTTMSWVSLTGVMPVAVIESNETLAAHVKPVPVIVTLVPPVDGPLTGLMLVTNGRGEM